MKSETEKRYIAIIEEDYCRDTQIFGGPTADIVNGSYVESDDWFDYNRALFLGTVYQREGETEKDIKERVGSVCGVKPEIIELLPLA